MTAAIARLSPPAHYPRGAILRREGGSENMLVVRDLGRTVCVVHVDGHAAGSLRMHEMPKAGLVLLLDQGLVPEDDGITPERRKALFDAGWEGARQGLQLAETAVASVRDNPRSSWAALVFGHNLYHAALAARRSAGACA